MDVIREERRRKLRECGARLASDFGSYGILEATDNCVSYVVNEDGALSEIRSASLSSRSATWPSAISWVRRSGSGISKPGRRRRYLSKAIRVTKTILS